MYSQNFVWTGLGILSFAVPDAGIYVFEGKLSLPSLSAGSSANSAVVVTVDVDSVEQYAGAAGANGFSVTCTCAAGDVVAIELASAADVDLVRNAVKATISASQGF